MCAGARRCGGVSWATRSTLSHILRAPSRARRADPGYVVGLGLRRHRALPAGDGPGVLPRVARRETVDAERGDRRAQRRDRHRVAGEHVQQVTEELRIALLDVADELVDLARRRARGVLEGHRNLRPPRLRDVLGEGATADHGQRERSDRREQAAQHSRAQPDVEATRRSRRRWPEGTCASPVPDELVAMRLPVGSRGRSDGFRGLVHEVSPCKIG